MTPAERIFAELVAKTDALTACSIATLHARMDEAAAVALAPSLPPPTEAELADMAARDAARRQEQRIEGCVRSNNFARRFPCPHDN